VQRYEKNIRENKFFSNLFINRIILTYFHTFVANKHIVALKHLSGTSRVHPGI